jgi:hypothetical protein
MMGDGDGGCGGHCHSRNAEEGHTAVDGQELYQREHAGSVAHRSSGNVQLYRESVIVDVSGVVGVEADRDAANSAQLL